MAVDVDRDVIDGSLGPKGYAVKHFFEHAEKTCHCFGVIGEAVPSPSTRDGNSALLAEDGQAVALKSPSILVFPTKNASQRRPKGPTSNCCGNREFEITFVL